MVATAWHSVPWPYALFLALLAAERLLEMMLSRRHARWSFARGGIEVGKGHFPVMVAMHTAFFVAAAIEVGMWRRPWLAALGVPMLGMVLLAQALRYWAIVTLGKRWNTRVIVIPGRAAIVRGPYRWLRHPNYVAVIVECFAVPLVHSAWVTAMVFTLLNGLLLRVRIGCEESALRQFCAYGPALSSRRAGVPRSSRQRSVGA